MQTVIVTDFGVSLAKTSERLVVRGPRPRLELVEGGPQLQLPLAFAPLERRLRLITSDGVKEPAISLRKPRPGARPKPEEVELPLFRVSEIVVASRGVSLSTDLIEACCESGIRITFLASSGKPYAMLSSPMLTATVKTRREQMAAYLDERGAEIARRVVVGKLRNQANLLKYFGKYQKRASPERYSQLAESCRAITALRREAKRLPGISADELRPRLLAIEGAAGRLYWAGLRRLLEPHAALATREHRGAADPVNAALNYGYGILYSQVWGAIMNAGLEPFAGFLHVDRPGKPSLVLDMVEELRQPIVDRAVVSLLNRGTTLDMHGGMLDEAARRRVAAAVLERLDAEVPFGGHNLRMRSILQGQARRLAAFVRGEGSYRPFAFKW